MHRKRLFTMDQAGEAADPKKKADAAKGKDLPSVEKVYELGTQQILAGTLALEVAVADVSKVYNLDPSEVREVFSARVEAARPKPLESAAADDSGKKALAAKLLSEAVEAEKFAAEATEIAKRARVKADAAAADAENRVLVAVPVSFNLSIRRANGQVDTFAVKAGSTTLPREQAEHSYAQAHGVKILGLPADDPAAKAA